ncbi:hypothetical protein ACPBZL_24930, partial [Escherichia coli]
MESPIMTQILRKAIENPIFAKEVLAVAPLTVFEGSPAYTEIAGIVKRYYQTNNKPLTEDALLTLT